MVYRRQDYLFIHNKGGLERNEIFLLPFISDHQMADKN